VSSFGFNDDAIRRAAQQATDRVASGMQELLDDLSQQEHGKDIDAVKADLREAWRNRFGRELTDPHLSAWAEQLANGRSVVIKVTDSREISD
jgi:DNA-binding GntR family transcriptional regulator